MLFREGNITPGRVVECGSYPVLFSNIADGKGVSLVLRCSISDEIQQKNKKIHPLTGEFNDFGIELLCRPEGHPFRFAAVEPHGGIRISGSTAA